MAAVQWKEGKKDAVPQSEALWNEALNNRALHMHCAYPQDVLTDAELAAISNADPPVAL
jgi:hypothetical protein